MSLTPNQVEAASRRSLLSRWLAGAAVAALAITGFVAHDAATAPAAHAAGETVSIDRNIFRHGDLLAVKVGNLQSSWDYQLELRNSAGQTKASLYFGTDANGVPYGGDTHQRLNITTSVPIGTGYKVVLVDDVDWYEYQAAGSVEIKAPFVDSSSLGTAVFNASNNTVTVSGTAFTNKDETAAAKIGVKLDNGAVSHANDPSDPNPVPLPWPVGGASPEGVWYYIGAGTLPNPSYGTNSISSAGNFTVTIPVPSSLSSGSHSLRFLTGSLATGDAARAKVVTFTK